MPVEQRIPISVSASGDNEIVAAVAGKQIRALQYSVVCANAVVLTWKSGSTAITGPMPHAANSGNTTPRARDHRDDLFRTAVGEPLVLNLSGNVAVGGWLVYVAR